MKETLVSGAALVGGVGLLILEAKAALACGMGWLFLTGPFVVVAWGVGACH